jgi:hypothetical protein
MAKQFKGREIANAVRPLRIRVTEADIDKGKPMDPEACAVAQCILRMTGADEVSVHRGVIMVVKGKKATRYMTSSSVRLEEIIFDRGGKFMPGEYDLKPVPINMIAPRKKSPSAPRTKRSATLGQRRLSIPGVRRRLNQKQEGEK